MINTSPLQIDKFSGGKTDYYLDGDSAQFKEADNFLLTNNEKLFLRPGIVNDNLTYYQIPAGNQRIGHIINFDNNTNLLKQSSLNLYTITGSGWTTIQGPTGSAVFTAATTTASYVSSAQWKKQVFLTTDAFTPPMKIYRKAADNSFLAVTAGYPNPSNYTAGVTFTSPAQSHNATTAAANTIQEASVSSYLAVGDGIRFTTVGGSGLALATTYYVVNIVPGTPDSFQVAATPGGAPIALVAAVAVVWHPYETQNAYIYKVTFQRDYIVDQTDQLEFNDEGPTQTIEYLNCIAQNGTTTITLNSLPVLTNAGAYGHNFDLTNTVKRIYRTTLNGTVFYLVAEIANGTTTLADTTTDEDLQTAEQLYTNGGVLDNDQPPPSKYIHIVDGRALYGNVKQGTQIVRNRVLHSFRDDPDSVPEGNFVDVDAEVMGLSSVASVGLIFTTGPIYRVDTYFNDLGQGAFSVQKISDYAGCLSHWSVVQCEGGVAWAGKDGFYFTKGFDAQKISKNLDMSYKDDFADIADPKKIQGTYDEISKRVYWSTPSGIMYVLDLNFGIKDESVFTTLSSAYDSTGSGLNLRPHALTVFNKKITWGDERGYTFVFDESETSDIIVKTSTAPSTWDTQPILWNYESCQLDLGTKFVRKWVPRINVMCENVTNLSLQITSINDASKKTADLAPIRYRGNMYWGDDIYWGDDSVRWNWEGVIDDWRRFPAGHLRCSLKQVKFTNATVLIARSGIVGDCTVNNTLNTATLNSPSTEDWPINCVGNYIYFDYDGYAQGYKIITRTADTLTLDDPNNNLPSGIREWEIRGIPKDEHFKLIGYVIHSAPLSKSQHPFQASDTGGSNG